MTEAGRPDPQATGEETEVSATAYPGSFPDSAAEMANETEVEGNQIEGELATLATQLAERTADLQRVQAEYLNYKRRVERDRDLVKQNATYAVLAPITEVLDTIDRAREHAEKNGQSLEGGFKAIAEQLERIVAGLGLVKFGAVGDPFDPTIHEALSHIGEDPEVSVTTCKVIAKAGYRIGDRVVRAAQVLVVDPAAGAAPAAAAGDVHHEREDEPGPAQDNAQDNVESHDVPNDDGQND